jgi:beta-mannosidase
MIGETEARCLPASASHVMELSDWTCADFAPGTITDPTRLAAGSGTWIQAAVPGTVASALAAAGRWDFDHPLDLDAFDWCYRTTFDTPEAPPGVPVVLHFDGLATAAEVWLNGTLILTAENMFRQYRVDVTSLLQASNELVCVFRSLKEELKRRRPRPRWKTNLVNHQQLRWQRTSLLGRIPGWSPCAPVIGPWRSVRVQASSIRVLESNVQTRVEGRAGVITVRARVAACDAILHAGLLVDGREVSLKVMPGEDDVCVEGELRIEDVKLWWPHTHGQQPLYDTRLVLTTPDGQHEVLSARVAFRTLEVDTRSGFDVRINGTPVFCRGACWTTSNLLSPSAGGETLARDLSLVRDAGANMLRVGGTMTYESDAFYRRCDELGLLVWQDFMFANMDYPTTDAVFHANILAEAQEQLDRLAKHPCVAFYCGNSEIEQQAAMLGMPRDAWSNAWFTTELAELCRNRHPGTVYVPSTPTGGALPFHTSQGITHYYGVGAYLRSSDDVRRADVKFTPECLGFANVPEPETTFAITGGALPVAHHPRWKARVPRDTGAGWDFEDVRDHYLGVLFGVDPVRLRSCDMPRYLSLSRVAPGEMMTQAFSEWRSSRSHNSGALVWFFKDLWPAAGWGIVDSGGMPKASYYFLKRVWAPRQLTVTDEGLNGLDIHLSNETDETVGGSVQVSLLREPNIVIAQQSVPVKLTGRSHCSLKADEILGRFHDVTYAYRFGPPQHDVAVVTWLDGSGEEISEAFHFITRHTEARGIQDPCQAWAQAHDQGEYTVTLTAEQFLHSVSLRAPGYLPNDNYFHLAPHRAKRVRFRPVGSVQHGFHVTCEALNISADIPVALRSGAGEHAENLPTFQTV